MDIKEIAKEMTREEFLDGILVNDDGDVTKIEWGKGILCPRAIRGIENGKCPQHCFDCW